MGNKAKNKKSRRHIPYSKKVFLAPDSDHSSAMIHTKVREDGIAQIKIADCNRTIYLWNDINDRKSVREMLGKIDTIISHLSEFRKEIEIKDETIIP
jgi:hypothetical protein